jgi:hypothetical protein
LGLVAIRGSGPLETARSRRAFCVSVRFLPGSCGKHAETA